MAFIVVVLISIPIVILLSFLFRCRCKFYLHFFSFVMNRNKTDRFFFSFSRTHTKKKQVNVRINVRIVQRHSSTNIIWPNTSDCTQVKNRSNAQNAWKSSRIQDHTANTWITVTPTANHTEKHKRRYSLSLIDRNYCISIIREKMKISWEN